MAKKAAAHTFPSIASPDIAPSFKSPASWVTESPTRRSKPGRDPFHFLRLPPELRNKVYEDLLTTKDPIEINSARQTISRRSDKFAKLKTAKARRNFKTIFLEILHRSKLVHLEATTVLYGNNLFKFRSDHKAGYLDPKTMLPERYLGLLRRVKFTVISREADNGQESMVAKLLNNTFAGDKTKLEMFELTWFGWKKFRLAENGVLCQALLNLDVEKVFSVKIGGDARMTTVMLRALTDGTKARKVEIIRPVFEVVKDGQTAEMSDQE